MAACSGSEAAKDGGRADGKDSGGKDGGGAGGSTSSGSGGLSGSGGSIGSGGTATGGTGGAVDAGQTDSNGDIAADMASVDAASDGSFEQADTSSGETTSGDAITGGDGAIDTVTDSGDAGGSSVDYSMLERNGDPARTGQFIRPLLTKANAMTMTADTAFNPRFQGNLWNVPLYLQNGPNNKGAFYVATQDNLVYALDETTGAEVWHGSAGPVAQGSPCGNSYLAVGVFSTPIIDAASRTLFVAAANGPTAIQSFQVHAFNVDTGAERTGWPVDVAQVISDFLPAKQNQRTALALVKGILYVAFGGHAGDCGVYRGRVLAIDISDPSKNGNWETTGLGEAIWGAGGMASDGDGVFALTGNGDVGLTAHLDSEEVVHLTGLAVLNRTDQNIFYPARWGAMDAMDLDMGCNAPALFGVPGATPAKYLVAPAKDGHLYFLDPTNLGGAGGELSDLVFAQESMSARTSPTAYMTTKGMFVALSTGAAHCPAGGPTGTVVMGVQVGVTAGAITPTISWCAALSGDVTVPISTTSDGTHDALVWYNNGGSLTAVDGETGAAVFSGASGCASQRFTSPIVGGAGRIVLGAEGKLCSFSVR
ncbi:MAG TPA: PQQ-binding-like beta-propeller repeat protein [Polyangia bacterium]